MNRSRKKLITTFCTAAVFLAAESHNYAFADGGVGVSINGNDVDFPDAKPYISDNRTFVPVRFVSEQLGAAVDWDSDTGTVVVTKDGECITLVIGSTEVVKSGIIHSMDAVPVITDGRTMVPLRFVSEQLGASVDWDAANNEVMISTSVTASETNGVYTIQSGDTLWDIALNNNVSLEELLEANPGMNPDKLTIGQQIDLPPDADETEPDSSPGAAETVSDSSPDVSRGGGRAIALNCTADELVEYAKEFLGVPYAYGGSTPEGFDCSGFTQYVTMHFGGVLPHSSGEQYSYGISVEREDLEPGDLVFFGTSGDTGKIGHVGIYVGDGTFIHAPQAGGTVEISNLTNVYFNEYYYGAVRMETEDAK